MTAPAHPTELTAEVTAFAEEHGLAPFLEPVFEMTRQIFSGRRVIAETTADYEIPEERYITVWVDVTGLTADAIGDHSDRWYAALRQICGRPRESLFHLGMEGK
jgi:hypothetical protein